METKMKGGIRRESPHLRGMSKEEVAVKFMDLSKQGWSARQIGAKYGLAMTTVYQYRNFYRKIENIDQVIALQKRKVGPEEMVPETTEAFEAFFNAYSGQSLQPHSKKFVEMALGNESVVINVPPRHAKSEIFSVWMPIWYIARDRDIQILLISQSQPQALKHFRKLAFNLENNDKLISDWGEFKPKDNSIWQPNAGKIIVAGRNRLLKSGDLTVLAIGAGGGITGLEANILIADDLVDTKNSGTEGGREKLSDWFHTDALSRLQPGAKARVVGTRFNLADLYAELVAKTRSNGTKIWTHINFPALDGDWESGTPLWPEMWPKEALREIYERQGSTVWAKTYQQDPVPPEARLVMPEWIYGDPSQGLSGCLDDDRDGGEGLEPAPDHVRILSIDPATTKFGGLILADLYYDREQFACSVVEAVRLEPGWKRMIGDHLERIIATYSPAPHHFVFEANASQRFFLEDDTFQAWSKRWDVRITPHTTSVRKADPTLGFHSLGPDFEFGRIRLPWGDPEGRNMSKLLINEATTWPFGSSDDILNALWFVKFNYGRLRPPHKVSEFKEDKKLPPRLYRRPWYARRTA